MTVTLLREKSPEYEAFLFEGVEKSGAEVEEWLGDNFESLIPTQNAVEFSYGHNRKYRTVAHAGYLILRRIGDDGWPWILDPEDLEDFEAVSV